MLSAYWRIRMINETGQTMTYAEAARIAIRMQEWKLVNGVLTRNTVITENLGFGSGTIADNGEVESAVVTNSGNWWGVHGIFLVLHDLDAASGVCRLYSEGADSDGNWPSDSDDFVITDLTQVAVLPIDNSAVDKSRSINFVL